jgi:hypothetical protein
MTPLFVTQDPEQPMSCQFPVDPPTESRHALAKKLLEAYDVP